MKLFSGRIEQPLCFQLRPWPNPREGKKSRFRICYWRDAKRKTEFSLFFVFFFRVTPVAYGGSQARGLIGATPAALCHTHSNADPSPVCYLHHSLQQCQILNLLREARDQTISSWILVCFFTRWARMGNSVIIFHIHECKNITNLSLKLPCNSLLYVFPHKFRNSL